MKRDPTCIGGSQSLALGGRPGYVICLLKIRCHYEYIFDYCHPVFRGGYSNADARGHSQKPGVSHRGWGLYGFEHGERGDRPVIVIQPKENP